MHDPPGGQASGTKAHLGGIGVGGLLQSHAAPAHDQSVVEQVLHRPKHGRSGQSQVLGESTFRAVLIEYVRQAMKLGQLPAEVLSLDDRWGGANLGARSCFGPRCQSTRCRCRFSSTSVSCVRWSWSISSSVVMCLGPALQWTVLGHTHPRSVGPSGRS